MSNFDHGQERVSILGIAVNVTWNGTRWQCDFRVLGKRARYHKRLFTRIHVTREDAIAEAEQMIRETQP